MEKKDQKKMIAHACRNVTPSGSFRAAIGYTEEGSTCYHCEVLVTKEMEIKFPSVE